jgi:ATP-dependent Clp protease protease subunit
MPPRRADLPPERRRPVIPDWPTPAPFGEPTDPPPDRPRAPLVLQPVVGWSTSLDEALLLRRIVAVTGALDAERATETAARLLHLDAVAPGDITLRLDCSDADVSAALMLIDTFGSMSADVHVIVVGQAVGAAVVVVAAADRSSIYPHARIVLTEPHLPLVEGDAAHLDAQLAEQRRLLSSAYDVIARKCGRSRDDIEGDARRRRLLSADEAVAYRLVDRVE